MQDWKNQISFFTSASYQKIQEFLREQRKQGKSILPKQEDILNAFKFTPFADVKVVILGQDPYPNKRHAHGLAFSIPKTTSDIPKSLQNIFKELEDDVGVQSSHGNLERWAKQGVLLLNTALTVEENNSNSHQAIGWQKLTQEVITTLSQTKEHCVYILWGKKAQKYKKYISNSNHLIIESPHPSPLSSYRGFFGSKCFSKTNTYLKQAGDPQIDWNTGTMHGLQKYLKRE